MAAGTNGPVAIAVSGGSDSLALMLLAQAWSRRSGRDLIVLTVDHGLRPEAREEAEWVTAKAASLGLSARGLTWTPDKRSQDAARQARHSLLAAAAREAGAGLLLLGHTRTDVEETLLMRLARPTTLAGAVGPQPVSVSPVWPEGRDILLGRPLIAVRRGHLMAMLAERGESWVQDPSNESDAYERVRMRKLAGQLDAARLSRITDDAMRLRAVEDIQLADMLSACVRIDPAGLVELQMGRLAGSLRLRARLLSILLQAAAGSDSPVAPQPLLALASDLASGGPKSRLTLGGAWLQRRGGTLMIGRDPGEVCAGWQDGIWDGRYRRAAPGGADVEESPFLVRHGMPDDPYEEILTGRLVLWEKALRMGAGLGVELAGTGAQSPSPVATTRPG
ncbi:tRNA lysidine(34) synthetase TilS [Henriciella mobilis]|nr:tRNA lysidine(34) synthetase TilS [Henriciella mobilis]RIJ25168.1 tRNA lysidine(34) synthetase TilS [Henriciella mobilis]